MLEDNAKMLRHGVQRMGRHFREKLSGYVDAVGVVELHGWQFIQRKDAPQMSQVKRRVMDDDAICGEQHPLEFWPDVVKF